MKNKIDFKNGLYHDAYVKVVLGFLGVSKRTHSESNSVSLNFYPTKIARRRQESQTTFRRRPLSYRNQSIDLLCKSMDWFIYNRGLRHYHF